MKQSLGFLDLPGEVRNKIYEYTFMDPDGICLKGAKFDCRRQVLRTDRDYLVNDRNYTWKWDSRSAHVFNAWYSDGKYLKSPTYERLGAGLLATNKTVYQEGLGLLYNRNMFFFEDPYALHTFLVNIGPRMASRLRDLTVVTWNDRTYKGYSQSCFTALLFATNIESLRLEMRNMRWHTSEWRDLARSIYENAFPWLEAVGLAKGNFDAALDILQVDPSTFGDPRGRQTALSPKKREDFVKDFKEALRMYLKRQALKFKTTSKSST